jgi:hypothetical protein
MSTPAAQVKTTPPAEIPCPAVLVEAAKMAMKMDRPILLDYFHDTYTGKAFIAEHSETKEKVLSKQGGEEFTSLIAKVFKFDADIVVLTENSIYIVSGKITKRILAKDQMPKND